MSLVSGPRKTRTTRHLKGFLTLPGIPTGLASFAPHFLSAPEVELGLAYRAGEGDDGQLSVSLLYSLSFFFLCFLCFFFLCFFSFLLFLELSVLQEKT